MNPGLGRGSAPPPYSFLGLQVAAADTERQQRAAGDVDRRAGADDTPAISATEKARVASPPRKHSADSAGSAVIRARDRIWLMDRRQPPRRDGRNEKRLAMARQRTMRKRCRRRY